MVRVVTGDILRSRAQTLVNTVNCVGVMGKGIALAFKKEFPDMYEDYVRRCKAGEVTLGRPYLYKRLILPWVLNFPTKDDWRSVARLQDIVRGLEYVERHYKHWGITSLAVPPLGCGQGQLEWRVVGPTLYRYLSHLEIPVELYAPFGTPHEELQLEYLEAQPMDSEALSRAPESKIPPAWVALVEILHRIEKEPYHWPIGRTTFQKLVYFATYEGIPTGLEYRQASYGPFAPALKRLVTQLVNNGLIREERRGRMLAVTVGPTFQDARRAFQTELDRWNEVIEKLSDLFLRMPTTTRAELAATVHYAAMLLAERTKHKPSERDVLAEVMTWKRRRRPPLNEQHVAEVIRTLTMIGWLDLTASSDLPVSEEVLLGV